MEECRKLPREFARVAAGDDLRQLSRGVTLSFGLAFSALLAAIYVPALIGISLMIDPLQKVARTSTGDGKEEKKENKLDIGEADPLRRVAATIATLSPLIAGLLANALSTG